MRHAARLLLPMLLLLAPGGCAADDAPTGAPVTGAPTDNATPPPTSQATASPTPTPGPTATPAPRVLAVDISPRDARVWVPPEGATPAPGYAITAQLSATVTMSDGSAEGPVTWSSDSPAIAAVDQTGLVTAVAPGAGGGPWGVGIRALASNGVTVGVAQVVVLAEGDLAVTVE